MHGKRWRTLAVVAVFALPGSRASAQPTRSELPMFLTEADRGALRARIAARVVAVVRTVPPAAGMRAPSPDRRIGAGLCLTGGRVLTAAALVADWPLGGRAGGTAADLLEVRLPGGGAFVPTAVGFSDPALGVAVLDFRDSAGPDRPSACPVANDPPPGDGDVGLATVLYGTVDGRAGLAEVAVRGPGQGPLGWYVVAAGDGLPAGTPLFSSRGTFVTLVGEAAAGGPGLVGLLPARAIRTFWDERFRWDP